MTNHSKKALLELIEDLKITRINSAVQRKTTRGNSLSQPRNPVLLRRLQINNNTTTKFSSKIIQQEKHPSTIATSFE